MEQNIRSFVKQNFDQMLKIHKELCLIPAPSHHEEQRAEYCKKMLESFGAKGVYTDSALNVIFPLNCSESNEITVFVAHTDTVFPDREPMPYHDDGEKIYCPGAADDTASVAVLLMAAKFFLENNIEVPNGIMFVCNSCEEGLGNLKGTRQLFKDYEGRIAQFISIDGVLTGIADECVGSHRYEVEVLTEGGHSFGKFGNTNAIAELAKIVTEIYKTEVPKLGNSRTTYNVGTIEGGTSVNTIAQSAKMLCEYRSDNKECLAIMEEHFKRIFDKAKSDKVTLIINKVGDRPCSNIDREKIEKLKEIVVPINEEIIGKSVSFRSSSTDCNIPLSLGIPALTIGANLHQGVHTREEWVDKASFGPGLEFVIKTAMALTK